MWAFRGVCLTCLEVVEFHGVIGLMVCKGVGKMGGLCGVGLRDILTPVFLGI